MIHLPSVPGLILCERVEVDRATGQFSLIGLFHTRRFPAYPTPLVAFTAYAPLFDGVGEGTLELVVSHVDVAQVIYTYQRWIAFADRMLTVHMEIKVKRCVFPAPGEYAVVLRFDGEELARRRLDLYEY